MTELTNQELLEKLETLINKKTLEIRSEINAINKSINKKLIEFEENFKKIEEKITNIERANRKNNILIFGIQTDQDNLLKTTLSQINVIFECNLTEKDLNNIYFIGKNNAIVVEFISFLQKKNIIKQLYKLKGTGISIANDLCFEDRKVNRILVRHLKEAKSKNLKTYIKNFKLFVNGVGYSAEELESQGEDVFDAEPEFILPFKNNSAPATPTLVKESSDDFEGTDDKIKNTEIAKKPEALKQTEIGLRTHIISKLPSSSTTTPPRNLAENRTTTNNSGKISNASSRIRDAQESRVLRSKKSTS